MTQIDGIDSRDHGDTVLLMVISLVFQQRW